MDSSSSLIEVASNERRAAAMVLVAAACFASLPTFTKIAYDDGTNPLGALTVRFVIAAVIVLAALRLIRGPIRIANRGATMALLIALFAGQSFCFFTSVEQNGAVRAVLLLYTYPLLTTLVGSLFLGERLTPAKFSILIVGFCGVVLAVGPLQTSFSATGLTLGLGSSVLFAGVLTVAKHVLARHGDALQMMGLVYAGTALLYLVVSCVRQASVPASPSGWMALVGGVALIGTVAAMTLLFSALDHLPAGTTSMLSTLEPALSVVLAAVVLGEAVSFLQAVGIVIVLGSIFALTRFMTTETEPVALEVIP